MSTSPSSAPPAHTEHSKQTKHTPLYDAHLAGGGKMVDFGGWEMPLHYGSQVDEHHQVRRAAGMFDVSHMLNIDVTGQGVRALLRTLIANNVDKLQTPGKALYACMLNPRGGVIDDLIVTFVSESHFRIVVNAATADKDVAWMRERILSHGAALELTPRRDLAMIAVQGPQARERVWQVWPHVRAATESLVAFSAHFAGDVMIARTGYSGEDGFEIVLPAADAVAFWGQLKAAGVAPCGLGARDTLRLEAGMNLYGNDMDDNVSPLDAGLAWTVDMKTPRDFTGRGVLEANGKQRMFVGLKLLERGVLRSHMKVVTPHGAGEITSGTFSPTLGFSIAMARVPKGVALGDTVSVELRGKLMPALVVKMPFVRNGKSLLE